MVIESEWTHPYYGGMERTASATGARMDRHVRARWGLHNHMTEHERQREGALGDGIHRGQLLVAAKKDSAPTVCPCSAALAKAASAAGRCLARQASSRRLGSSPIEPEGWYE